MCIKSGFLYQRNVISFFAVNSLIVLTPAELGYKYFWYLTHREVFTFRLKSCRESRVLLSAVPGDVSADNAYEVIIGAENNTKTIIRNVMNNDVSITTNKILDCDTSNRFWIRHTGNEFYVGKGEPYQNKFIDLQPQKVHTVQAISITTNTAFGQWEFDQNTGT